MCISVSYANEWSGSTKAVVVTVKCKKDTPDDVVMGRLRRLSSVSTVERAAGGVWYNEYRVHCNRYFTDGKDIASAVSQYLDGDWMPYPGSLL